MLYILPIYFLFFNNIFNGRPRSNEFSGTTGWIFTNISGWQSYIKAW